MGRISQVPDLAQQAFALRAGFGGRTKFRRGSLAWRGVLQPSAVSDSYEVRVQYQVGWHPKVTVTAPTLEPNDLGILPHYYPNSGTLCLYDPQSCEWTSRMFLAATIIPWTAEWLLHYEIWIVTGKWHGSGDDMAWAHDPGPQPLRAA